jgi:dCTP diphosphatase
MLQIQENIRLYLEERGWDKLAPADLAKSITIESAELLELFQWENHTAEEINHHPELRDKVQKEMADVMIYCTELAIHLGIDVEEAMQQKLHHNAEKYPPDEIRKHSGEKRQDSFYMKQKIAYRKAGK